MGTPSQLFGNLQRLDPTLAHYAHRLLQMSYASSECREDVHQFSQRAADAGLGCLSEIRYGVSQPHNFRYLRQLNDAAGCLAVANNESTALLC